MKLVEIIKNFASQENTDFAILINGSWGSGKTFFLKKTVAEEVKKINCNLSDTETKPFELVYVSLYGLSSADELQRRLFLEINPALKTKGGKFVTALIGKGLDYMGLGADDKDEKTLLNIFGGITKNKILVFDDLERLGDDTINEVLGFINTYTEHQNLKVIIVADEAKIKAKIGDYDSVKEKLIRFTYLFNPELKDVFPSFITRYKSVQYQEYLKLNSNLICDLFEKGQHRNLRSLRFLLDIFENIFTSTSSIPHLSKETKEFILDRFLYFVSIYSIEYKKGVNEILLSAIKNMGSNLRSPGLENFFLKNWEFNIQENDDAEEFIPDDREKYKTNFENSYLVKENSNFEYFDFLVNYIHSGDLDLQLLQDTCLDYQGYFERTQEKPEFIALNKLKNCLNLNDNEFIPLVDEIYTYIDASTYKLEDYPIIFQNLLNCSLNGIANLTIDKNTVVRFKKGMTNSLSKSQYRQEFDNYISLHIQDNEMLQEIRDYAFNLNNTLQVNSDRLLAEKVISLMVSASLQEFHDIMNEENTKNTPIFQIEYISPESFVAQYDALSNKEKNTVYESFYNSSLRFNQYQNSSIKQLPFFEKVHFLISAKIVESEGNKQLSTSIHIRFKLWLEQTIKKLNNIAQNHFD